MLGNFFRCGFGIVQRCNGLFPDKLILVVDQLERIIKALNLSCPSTLLVGLWNGEIRLGATLLPTNTRTTVLTRL